jgi:hypothetical protein
VKHCWFVVELVEAYNRFNTKINTLLLLFSHCVLVLVDIITSVLRSNSKSPVMIISLFQQTHLSQCTHVEMTGFRPCDRPKIKSLKCNFEAL